jgi:hypothetical protein
VTPMAIAGGQIVLLSWRSDGSLTEVGWALSWSSGCPEGRYAVNATACGDCIAPAGFSCRAGSNSSAGLPCSAGRYGVGGAASCVDCTAPRGSSCVEGSNSTLGTPCGEGFTSGGGTAACVPGCGGRRAQRGAGIVRTGNPAAGGTYNSNEACEWLLEADVGRLVFITVMSFSTVFSEDTLTVISINGTTQRVRLPLSC